jgi:hypothetical protein
VILAQQRRWCETVDPMVPCRLRVSEAQARQLFSGGVGSKFGVGYRKSAPGEMPCVGW